MNQNEIEALVARTETKSRRMSEEQIVGKYPNHNIKPGSLHTVDGGRKQAVVIVCECGNEREVRTSDLFQVKMCRDCKKAQRKKQTETTEPEEAPAPTEVESTETEVESTETLTDAELDKIQDEALEEMEDVEVA